MEHDILSRGTQSIETHEVMKQQKFHNDLKCDEKMSCSMMKENN